MLVFALQRRSPFSTPGRAIIKTMTMTTGEFEYDDIFLAVVMLLMRFLFLKFQLYSEVSPLALLSTLGTPHWYNNYHSFWHGSHSLHCLGPNMPAICGVLTLKFMCSQVDLASSVEAKFPTGLRHFFIRGEYTVVPNRKLSSGSVIKHLVQRTTVMTAQKIYLMPFILIM